MTSGDGFQGEGFAELTVLEAVPDREPTSPEQAADILFDDPRARFEYEPADEEEARRAVDRFRHLFDDVPGALRTALDGARAGAEMLSGDRLQGLAEIIQNADDTRARTVEFRVVGDTLIATHDGTPVRLPDVLALALPWLSNKTEDASATGRFGIGLMTLRVLSDVLDVHSGPYHVRLGDPTISTLDGSDLQGSVDVTGVTTVFCIPLDPDSLTSSDIEEWLRLWDDSALLFLRSVERVVVRDAGGGKLRTLSLEWFDEESPASCVIAGTEVPVRRRHARSPDSRSWIVHSTEPTAPPGVSRARKATGTTVPLGIALPLQPESQGSLHAGLPVVETSIPVRINAQFDPITGRHQLANTPWNDALLPLIGDLWAETVVDLFTENPALGWAVVPLPPAEETTDATTTVASSLESLLLARARDVLVERLTVTVDGAAYPLASLAVEDQRLEGVITLSEVAALADLSSSLPTNARDPNGRWREVLDDWRSSGAELPAPVTVLQALDLLEDDTRSTTATIALVAAGLDGGLDSRLATLPCVITASGDRLAPPTGTSLEALVLESSPLAEALGVGLRIDDEYLADTDDAQSVLMWLRKRGGVIDGSDSEVVVRRIAAAGRAGKRLSHPLTDEQAVALRDAFEAMNPEDRPPLGREVGKVILLDAYHHDTREKRVAAPAHPAEAYLPRTIDKEPDSFSRAADTTPGLRWLHARYADSLRSSRGRAGGLGPQRFLRLLGAEIGPRVTAHPGLQQRFVGVSLGLPVFVNGGPPERQQALTALGASYTLSDIDSPDLRAVVAHIAAERRRVRRRRERADALLGSLARAWDRLSEDAEVTAAEDYYSWQNRGTVPAFWLWAVGATAWLDDTDGTPQAPLNLRIRTPATIAVHGPDAQGYLRAEFNAPNRREVLTALGVTGEPSTRDLVDRLRTLRDDPEDHANIEAEAAIVYQALAERMSRGRHGTIPGDLSVRDLRTVFGDGDGLVLTQLGWRPPTNVLSGDPVFGDRRAFVPQVRNSDRLWTALQIRQPSLDDSLKVVGELARTRTEPVGRDLVVLLDTLRVLVQRISPTEATTHPIRRLAKVALWTTKGWTIDRPVYAVADPSLAESLGAQVPVWMPGGELSQFEPLIDPLRIQLLDTEHYSVVDPEQAVFDKEATEVFRTAVPLLHEDLARNDPDTEGSLRIPWPHLESFEVHVDPALSIRVDGLVGDRSAEVPVIATADADPEVSVLYLAAPSLLRQVEGGGRAIARLFGADARSVSQAWLAACIAAQEGREAQRIELASQRAQEEQARRDQDVADQLAAFRQETAGRHTGGRSRRRPTPGRTSAPSGDGSETPEPSPTPPARPRVLVDPDTLGLTDPMGTPGGDGAGRRPPARRLRSGGGSADRPLPEPNRDGAPPRGSTPPTNYTQQEKEAVGLELVRMVLAGDAEEIVDLRAQHGVGADAIDELDRFFELKVHGGEEPQTIRLQESEIRRAMSTPNFFLVVVSHVEGVEARPKVRIIIDPVNQLRMVDSSSVSFTGVRSAEHSLVYEFAPLPADESADDTAGTAPTAS